MEVKRCKNKSIDEQTFDKTSFFQSINSFSGIHSVHNLKDRAEFSRSPLTSDDNSKELLHMHDIYFEEPSQQLRRANLLIKNEI